MKQIYAGLFWVICSLWGGRAHAQYTFADTKLNPYRQNFNTLYNAAAPATPVTLTGNQLNSMPEVYAQAEFSGYPYNPPAIVPNDGGTPTTQGYYHFGPASGDSTVDRALGGIASSETSTGIGSVGIRFKNGTAATIIKNLEVQYAMEQWYNSTLSTQAQVVVSYLLGPSTVTQNADGTSTTTYAPVTSLQQSAGNWVDVPDLRVSAPSTATDLGKRDGNAASNRRVLNALLAVNLAPGQEIMIRWTYVLNTNTNGNGLSIDDVVVAPETDILYSKTTGSLDDPATWGTNPDGTGTAPTSFAADNRIYYVQGETSTTVTDRIAGATWAVSGQNSKIVVGTTTSPAALKVVSTKNIVGTIDVGPNSYFYHNHPAGTTPPAFMLGVLAATSTIEYNSDGQALTLQANQYGNLKLTGGSADGDRATNKKVLSGNTIVTGTLSFGAGNNLALGDYDLTVLSGGSINIDGAPNGTGYVVTNGTGQLRMQVPRATSTAAGPAITFPVGTSYTSYTPVTLQQTSTTSDNVFEVRVLDGVYASYDNTTGAPGPKKLTNSLVNKTWLISKETTNEAVVTMGLQWNTGESTPDFTVSTAHINHYTEGVWDVNNTQLGVGTTTGPYVATRTGISSFSPFSVSSKTDGTLPVTLLAFKAKRTGAVVACTWATATEHDNDYFTVERSTDGVAFVALGTVQGVGNSMKQATYSFDDQAPLASVAYYRLRQTDLDGTSSFSPVVSVAGQEIAPVITAAPNPSTGQFDIWVTATEVTAAEITNVLGARVLLQTMFAADGGSRLSFDLSAQASGVYFVKLQTTTGTHTVRVIKN